GRRRQESRLRACAENSSCWRASKSRTRPRWIGARFREDRESPLRGARLTRELKEEIFSPLIVTLTQQTHQMAAGMQTEGSWLPSQFHAGLLRGPAALVIVAGVATGNEILPRGFAGARARNDVVKRKLAGRKCAMAILAGIAVSHQNVLARQRARLVRNTAIFEQTDYRGHRDGAACGMDGV